MSLGNRSVGRTSTKQFDAPFKSAAPDAADTLVRRGGSLLTSVLCMGATNARWTTKHGGST